MEHSAVTQAAEDDAWLLLACSPDERLTVSVIHNEQFPYPLKASSSVKIRSKNVPAVSVEGKSIKNDQIFVDPIPMRHIMPMLLQFTILLSRSLNGMEQCMIIPFRRSQMTLLSHRLDRIASILEKAASCSILSQGLGLPSPLPEETTAPSVLTCPRLQSRGRREPARDCKITTSRRDDYLALRSSAALSSWTCSISQERNWLIFGASAADFRHTIQ
jgi:hypothetical protein